MLNLIVTAVSLIVLALGIVALISPIPIGVVMITISLSSLVCVNPRARRMVKRLRSKHRQLNARIYWLETRLNGRFNFVKEALRDTRPSKNR